MSNLISNTALLHDLGERFIQTWEKVGFALIGTLPAEGQAALAHLEQGHYLRDEDTKGLCLIGQALIETYDRIEKQPGVQGNGHLARKFFIAELMLHYTTFMERRDETLACIDMQQAALDRARGFRC